MNTMRSYKDVAAAWTPVRATSPPIQTIVPTIFDNTNRAPPASYEHTSEHRRFDNPCRNPNRPGNAARARNLRSRAHERSKRKWDRQTLRLPPVEDEQPVMEEPVEEPHAITGVWDFWDAYEEEVRDEEWCAWAEEEQRRYEEYEAYRDYCRGRYWDW